MNLEELAEVVAAAVRRDGLSLATLTTPRAIIPLFTSPLADLSPQVERRRTVLAARARELAETNHLLQRRFLMSMSHELRTPLNVREIPYPATVSFFKGGGETEAKAKRVGHSQQSVTRSPNHQAVIGFNTLVIEEGSATLGPTLAGYLRSSLTAAKALLGIITHVLEVRPWDWACCCGCARRCL